MRRSRFSAVLVAVVVAMSALLVPGTAQADATDVTLSADFDILSVDRIATVTLKAKSESGITGVEATVKHRQRSGDTTIGSLPLTLVDGTENDGTWKAEYEVDTEAHPGFIVFDAVVTTADGATATRAATIKSCYQGQFADLTTTPETVDYAHREITIKGRLLLRKTHGAELEPAPGVTVRGVLDAETRTEADGSFALVVPTPNARVYVGGGSYVCSTYDSAPAPETERQWTLLPSEIVTPQPVQVGDPVTVEGRLERQTADGVVPVGNKWLFLSGRVGATPLDLPDPVRTAKDGTFQLTFTAGYSGLLVLSWEGGTYLHPTQELVGQLTVRQGAEITDVVIPDVAPYGEAMNVTGRLVRDGSPVGNGRIQLEFARSDATDFTVVSTGRTAADGTFSLNAEATNSGRWRVVHVDGEGNAVAVSEPAQVDVKYRLRLNDLSAEPTDDGRAVTVRGNLVRFADEQEPADRERVDVYFMPDGGSEWEYQGRAYTGEDGAFEETFTATGDGRWTAASWETDRHLSSNAPIVHADVTVQYATAITEFSAAPESVNRGGKITVKGLLTRRSGGADPAPAPGEPVHLYFLPAGSSEWTQVAVVETGADGRFEKAFTAEQGGNWTAWYWGDDQHAESNSHIEHVDVAAQYATEIIGFGATPESVAAGGTITVEGVLNRGTMSGEPMSGEPVHLYFLPAGSSEWTQVAMVETGADGRFEKTFTAEQDGYWTAWFFGDDQHLQVNSGSKYVDVQ